MRSASRALIPAYYKDKARRELDSDEAGNGRERERDERGETLIKCRGGGWRLCRGGENGESVEPGTTG